MRHDAPDAFRRMVKENAVEMKDIAHALSRPASDPVVTAAVTSPKGDSLLLLYEDGRWKLDGSSIDLPWEMLEGDELQVAVWDDTLIAWLAPRLSRPTAMK